jgi:hypothetical protein
LDSPPDLGCMGELTMQLAIVFVGRQTINNIQEMVLPALFRWWRLRSEGAEFSDAKKRLTPWERDVRGTASGCPSRVPHAVPHARRCGVRR